VQKHGAIQSEILSDGHFVHGDVMGWHILLND